MIEKWVNQFKTNGKEGLKTKRRNATYPLNFKLNVLRFKQDTGASYIDTANAFGISEPSIIANWHRQYERFGTQGLNKPLMELYNQALVLHKTENHCYLFIVN